MSRPTIAGLAARAGVSVSTINRLLRGDGSVRQETSERILDAAAEIGFYGLGALQQRKRETLPRRRLGFLLQQSHRSINRLWASAIEQQAARHGEVDIAVDLRFADTLSPESIAETLAQMGEATEAIALVTADHPIVSQAIDDLREKGVPVVAYVTDLSAQSRAGFVGTDNWKLGRTAAWFLSQLSSGSGAIASLIGTHRYQCQDFSDASFRSYMREHAPAYQVGESQLSYEEPDVAYDIVKKICAEQPDLRGIFVNGGGISGVLRALREVPEEDRKQIKVVCRDIGPETRKGLTEGLISAAFCHPVEQVTDELLSVMLRAIDAKKGAAMEHHLLPFEIITPESMWT